MIAFGASSLTSGDTSDDRKSSASKEITSFGAVELARLIRKGQLSAQQVVEAHIRRIEEVNPYLNALVGDCFSRARCEAKLVGAAPGSG